MITSEQRMHFKGSRTASTERVQPSPRRCQQVVNGIDWLVIGIQVSVACTEAHRFALSLVGTQRAPCMRVLMAKTEVFPGPEG